MPKVSSKHKEEKRNEIVSAALNVFKRKGYEATTMKDIVEASGRSFGGVYMYYSSKEEIFIELLMQAYAGMGQDLIIVEERSAWETLQYFMDRQLHHASKAEDGLSALLYEYFVVGRKQDKRKLLIQQRHQGVYSSLYRLLISGVDSGEFRQDAPIESLTHLLISFLDGVFFESLVTGADRIRIEDQFQTMLKMLQSVLIGGQRSLPI